ncbi:hypothetical protein Taro_020079 [Colocasia esculenta]|uniref:Uncharacterized protein n=1 Tax=Colocasia esculenta TaxID=4460 RepID=A0A843V124_COLES|nr:hypothetical protein [Colocasia esculenta]
MQVRPVALVGSLDVNARGCGSRSKRNGREGRVLVAAIWVDICMCARVAHGEGLADIGNGKATP